MGAWPSGVGVGAAPLRQLVCWGGGCGLAGCRCGCARWPAGVALHHVWPEVWGRWQRQERQVEGTGKAQRPCATAPSAAQRFLLCSTR
eukprot:XP_001703700.1 predicted protein [Chlamydomonas reinhardtii]